MLIVVTNTHQRYEVSNNCFECLRTRPTPSVRCVRFDIFWQLWTTSYYHLKFTVSQNRIFIIKLPVYSTISTIPEEQLDMFLVMFAQTYAMFYMRVKLENCGT